MNSTLREGYCDELKLKIFYIDFKLQGKANAQTGNGCAF
jgi:hypothetical protein